MTLSCIKLTHFKCFEQLDLTCKRLNLLCGLNGTGKSSIFQVMLILRQSFESGELPKGRLLLGGDRADLGTGSDVLFEDADRDVLGFALSCDEAPDQWELNFGYSRTADQLTVLQDRAHTQEALVLRQLAGDATVWRQSRIRQRGARRTEKNLPLLRDQRAPSKFRVGQ